MDPTTASLRHIEFEARVRILGPQAHKPNLQSVYVFNMYRAGSSVTEAVAEALAWGSSHTPWNIVRELDRVGVHLIDPQDYSRSASFIASDRTCLDEMTNQGGYLFYGFREIPQSFAERFTYIAASVIVSRDPRDIGISQYAAIKRHAISGASGENIKKLREQTSAVELDEFLLSDGTLAFLRRITRCYEPLLKRGCTLLRYEEFMTFDGFDLAAYTAAVSEAIGRYLSTDRRMPDILRNLDQRIANSKGLQGHASGGQIKLWQGLSPATIKALTKALEPELRFLGYV